jgi:hypothetical protein
MTALLTPADLAPQPLDHALALPAPYYTDPRLPALDAAAVFARSWQLVGHAAQLSGVGSDNLPPHGNSLPYGGSGLQLQSCAL